MDLYILDDQFRRIEIIDTFQSLIWTERWQEIGELELELPSNSKTKSLFGGIFSDPIRLAIDESYRVMVVETVEETRNDDDSLVLLIKGRSLEKILENRIVKQTLAAGATSPEWDLSGNTALQIANQMFNHICRSGNFHPNDIIPHLMPQNTYLLPKGDIPEGGNIDWYQRIDYLYNGIKAVCERNDLGFRLLRNGDETQLSWEVYLGSDLTSNVIFDSKLDSFELSSYINSIRNVKNSAYVYTVDTSSGYEEHDTFRYRPNNVVPTGFERKLMLLRLNFNEIDHPFNIQYFLARLGTETLRLPRYQDISIIDGEVGQNKTFKYGDDYQIGDVVEIRDDLGNIESKRVTECIFVSDQTGNHIYPTLSKPFHEPMEPEV